MRNVLIISYFYPPCSLTAAQRPAGWVKYLPSYGYRPIVITRNWNVPLQQPEDQLRDAGIQLEIEETDSHEVHYLPYRSSIRDRLFTSKNSLLKKTSKVFTLVNSFGENYANCFIPFGAIYAYAEKLIAQHTISAVLITGNPFVQFRFGYLLSKKYHLPWVADYRDDWTTSEIIYPKGIVARFLHLLQQRFEQKWVGSASVITSVSDVYTDRIAKFVKVKGVTVLNGFDSLLPQLPHEDPSTFKITYNGTLYATQDVESFLRAVIRCIPVFNEKIKIQVQFPGVAYDPLQEKRIKRIIVGYESHFLITPRISKSQVILMQQTSDLLLMLTHKGKKGIPSSKLYEYLSLQKPILCFPSDHDVVAQTLADTGNGKIVETELEIFHYLSTKISTKIESPNSEIPTPSRNILVYSQNHQVKQLSLLLTKLISEREL